MVVRNGIVGVALRGHPIVAFSNVGRPRRAAPRKNAGEPMKLRKLVAFCLLVMAIVTPAAAQTRDERLWQRALQIHRRAIVIDTHNDVTSAMTNDDFDLSGTPPAPYRTNIARMKQGGLTGE